MKRLATLAGPVLGFLALMAIGRAIPSLTSVLDLALPFFGLILLGWVCGKLMDIPEAGLAWMNAFIVYVALPALFFNLVSVTPIEELANTKFVMATLACTAVASALGFGVGMLATRGRIADSAIMGVAGGYSNVGYMGPGLTLAALGTASVVPTALIFVFDSMFFFTAVPFLMAFAGGEKGNALATARLVVFRVVTHPFNIATALGVLAAWGHVGPPVAIGKMLTVLQGAAAPCALFVMGVTVAKRPMTRVAPELPVLLFIKLVFHPLLIWLVLSALGDFNRVWTFTAVLMAALPPALNVFVMASQYRVYVERASSTILVGTIVSVVTVTALLYVIGSGSLPHNLLR